MSTFQFGQINQTQTEANAKAGQEAIASKTPTGGEVGNTASDGSAGNTASPYGPTKVVGSTGVINVTAPTVTTESGTTKVSPVSVNQSTGLVRSTGEHCFKVQLDGEPEEEVFASDRLEAQQRYCNRLGVISTTRAFRITQVD